MWFLFFRKKVVDDDRGIFKIKNNPLFVKNINNFVPNDNFLDPNKHFVFSQNMR